MTKKSTKILIIILAAYFALLIAVAAVTACFIMSSLYSEDYLENTLDAFFPDRAALEKMNEEWIKDGIDSKASICLPGRFTGLVKDVRINFDLASGNAGSEKGSFTLSLQVHESAVDLAIVYDRDTVAVKDLRADSDEYFILPRKDIASALEDSVFSPDSGSAYALDQNSFDELKSALERLEGSGAGSALTEKEAEEIKNALDNVMSKVEESLEIDSSIGLSGGLKLSRIIDVSISKETVNTLFDAVLREAEQNETFKKYIDSIYFDSVGGIEELAKTLGESIDKLNAELSLYISGKAIVGIALNAEAEGESFGKSSISAYVTFIYKRKSASIGAVIDTVSSFDGKESKERISIGYSNEKSKNETVQLLNIINSKSNEGSGAPEEKTTSFKLTYDKRSGSFSLLSAQSGAGTVFEFKGKYLPDPQNTSLELTIDEVFQNGQQIIFERIVDISAKKLADQSLLTIPEGRPFFGMSEAELEEFIYNFPLYHIESIFSDITGRVIGFSYTNDHKLIHDPAGVSERVNDYIANYNTYLIRPEEDKNGKDIYNVLIYDEESGLYLAIGRLTGSEFEAHIYAEVPESIAKKCHEARLRDDGEGLLIHDFKLITDIAPTCTEGGKQVYSCSFCYYKISNSFPELDHLWVKDTYENVVHDNGQSGTVKVDYCQRCKASYYLYSPYFSANINLSQDGEFYTITNYRDNRSNFCGIPDSVIKGINISSFTFNSSDSPVWYTLRIPEGVEQIKLREASVQVLIIPRSLKQIDSNNYASNENLNLIYYCGTEEEWAKIELNGYREIWKDVKIVFCPDGVTPEMLKDTIVDEKTANDALDAGKTKPESGSFPEEMAKLDNVRVIDSGKVTAAAYDKVSGLIAVCGVYDGNETEIRIFELSTGKLYKSFKISDDVHTLDIGDGHVAAASRTKTVIYVYKISDEELSTVKLEPYSILDGDHISQVFIDSGYLYACNKEQYCNIISHNFESGKTEVIANEHEPLMFINKDKHRLAIFMQNGSSGQSTLIDTQTATVIRRPWCDWGFRFPVGEMETHIMDKRGNAHDLDGNQLASVPADVYVKLSPKAGQLFLNDIYLSSKARVKFFASSDGTFGVAVRYADGRTAYAKGCYAEKAVWTDSGVLVYTPGGYGLMLIIP